MSTAVRKARVYRAPTHSPNGSRSPVTRSKTLSDPIRFAEIRLWAIYPIRAIGRPAITVGNPRRLALPNEITLPFAVAIQ
jgi:hypothetical protein